MIVIVGESASGKTTLQNMFIEKHPEYRKIITYTTRPIRDGEVNGIDYNFISQEAFNELDKDNFFAETATYRNWSYGTAKRDCVGEKVIAVLTPAGLRALKDLGCEITSIYLCVDRRSRLVSILERGDDVDEAYRRNLSDVGQFDGIVNEVDYVIDNIGFFMDKTRVLNCLENILQVSVTKKE